MQEDKMTEKLITYGDEEMCTEFWWGNFKRPLKTPRHKWRIILKYILKKKRMMAWTEFAWIRIQLSSEL
jgi:hypothetical protein